MRIYLIYKYGVEDLTPPVFIAAKNENELHASSRMPHENDYDAIVDVSEAIVNLHSDLAAQAFLKLLGERVEAKESVTSECFCNTQFGDDGISVEEIHAAYARYDARKAADNGG